MFSNRKMTLVVISVLVAVFAFGAWNAFAQDDTTVPCDFTQMYGLMGDQGMQGRGMDSDMMGSNLPEDCYQNGLYGMGMMGGMMGQNRGMGMMGFDSETMGRFGPGTGMMGAWTPPTELAPSGVSLTFDEAVLIAETYIADWDTESPLELGEVMQFDNHFYAMAREVETGRGAFEFLIDPNNGTVFGEPGPNMMWNLQYGMSMGQGMGIFASIPINTEMTVSIDQSLENAQAVLDDVLPGIIVDETETDTFYGYYTLHILQDNNIVGMLSVNGYTGQVWLHHWHDGFVTMTEHTD
ncbi:MAG: hypothetical protein WBC91_24425 [Phototrophicaceae bacterium]